jgi:hypothetical protein
LLYFEETGKRIFSIHFKQYLCQTEFHWAFWTETHGRSRGILLGGNLDVYDIGSIDEADFYVKFHLRNETDGLQWILVVVYGAAKVEFKEALLPELVQTCASRDSMVLSPTLFWR